MSGPPTHPDALLGDPQRRDDYVQGIFDLIAPRYDRFTRWFSYGMDAAWKRDVERFISRAVHHAGMPPDPVVVDLACGTGDLALAAQFHAPRGTVIGIDVSQVMLAQAVGRASTESLRRAPGDGGMHFTAADMARLPLAPAAADLITAGYALRNAPRLGDALDEVSRVIKPGGWLVTLDFFLPTLPGWRQLFLGYLTVAGWIFGWALHRRPDTYVYIPRSIRRFVTPAVFERELRARGLRVLHVRRKLLGAVVVHVARKEIA